MCDLAREPSAKYANGAKDIILFIVFVYTTIQYFNINYIYY